MIKVHDDSLRMWLARGPRSRGSCIPASPLATDRTRTYKRFVTLRVCDILIYYCNQLYSRETHSSHLRSSNLFLPNLRLSYLLLTGLGPPVTLRLNSRDLNSRDLNSRDLYSSVLHSLDRDMSDLCSEGLYSSDLRWLLTSTPDRHSPISSQSWPSIIWPPIGRHSLTLSPCWTESAHLTFTFQFSFILHLLMWPVLTFQISFTRHLLMWPALTSFSLFRSHLPYICSCDLSSLFRSHLPYICSCDLHSPVLHFSDLIYLTSAHVTCTYLTFTFQISFTLHLLMWPLLT
jgi:hypothetical protein